MARSRTIKPAFFVNESLVELPFSTRLLFIALWTQADREGCLEDRPKRIKMAAFPADDVDVEAALDELCGAGFLDRYEADGLSVIQIANFTKHQRPHPREAESVLPAKPEQSEGNTKATPRHDQGSAKEVAFPSSHPTTLQSSHPSMSTSRFADFWSTYPRKVGKKPAREKWKAKKLDNMADQIINDVRERAARDRKWLDGYAPNPATYLAQERWTDEIEERESSAGEAETRYRSLDEVNS